MTSSTKAFQKHVVTNIRFPKFPCCGLLAHLIKKNAGQIPFRLLCLHQIRRGSVALTYREMCTSSVSVNAHSPLFR